MKFLMLFCLICSAIEIAAGWKLLSGSAGQSYGPPESVFHSRLCPSQPLTSRCANMSAKCSPMPTPPTRALKSMSGNSTPSGEKERPTSMKLKDGQKCLKNSKSYATASKMDTCWHQIDIVAATICAEAGGEPFFGRVKVGEVIANRAIKSGKSQCAVCLSPKQFSCWNNRTNTDTLIKAMKKHPAWVDCMTIAENISQPGYTPDSSATHYYAWKKIKPPYWAKNMELVVSVGGHRFYREAL
jgi:spore germination cell wall hydrolase CwlJ-like protein